MCGICGVLDFAGREVPREVLHQMAATLTHRGPDEQASFSEPGIGLGHTRLSIIDLAGSHQPMRSADGNWVIVFNGEIFNYRELARDLDYPFSTHGDTEVILAGLTGHGIDFVQRLRGQFAFAAYDRRTRTLHLVRDRLGILPLYYRFEGERLVFGSEVKAILAAGGPPPQVDHDSLDAYLAGRSVPAPHTMFAEVMKLPAGHRGEVSADGQLRLIGYWQPPAVDDSAGLSATAATDLVEAAMREAVEAAMVADVPVGSYLSGGVDSSLIVALMRSLRGPGQQIETFAAGFGDPRADELPWARLVSEQLGTNHHEVQLRADDFAELWPRMTWHRDAPISEPADMAVFRLAELARQHVRVVLSGEGGDELFCGYPKYQLAGWLSASRVVPAGARAAVAGAVDQHLPQRLARGRIALRALAAPTEAEQLQAWFAPFTAPERRALLGQSLAPRPRESAGGADAIDRMLRHDLASWLPDNLLERGDRMSMAASLELRPPLLDHRLVELAFTLPSRLKVRQRTTKWLLKEVARRYLPAEVVDRRKVGFRVPLDAWFRAGLRDSMWDRLTGPSSFVGNELDRASVQNLLQRHDSGRFNEDSRLWTLLSLEVWHEVCIRGAARPEVALR